MELYWEGKTELLGEKIITARLGPPQISHRMPWDRIQASEMRDYRIKFRHNDKALNVKFVYIMITKLLHDSQRTQFLLITKVNCCLLWELHETHKHRVSELQISLILRHVVYNRRIKNQLDATYYFIALLIGSTCFGHYYAHHQKLANIMLITTLVVSVLVCCRLEVRCGWAGMVSGLQAKAQSRTPPRPNRT